jgi:hypothetical protein
VERSNVGVVIAAILQNLVVVLFAVAVCTTAVKCRCYRRARLPYDAPYVLWGEVLFYTVGIGFVYAGLLHAYAQQMVAPTIGWTPSPFEYELGWIEIPLGVVAALALWRGFEFRLASTVVAATFGLAAAAQHVQQIVCCANYAPGNAGLVLWFGDVFVPIFLLLLAILSRRAGGDRSVGR